MNTRALKANRSHQQEGRAFTLIEVMIAVAIFVMSVFAILNLVTQNLRAARSLKITVPSPGLVMTPLIMTNRLEEGKVEGTFEDFFGKMNPYPDHSWSRELSWVLSNGLFKVDIVIKRGGDVESTMTTLIYKPQSARPTR